MGALPYTRTTCTSLAPGLAPGPAPGPTSCTMSSPVLGWSLILANLVLCHLSVSLSPAAPALATAAALLATILIFLAKKRVPVMALWPLTALAVVAQTFATSSLASVPATVMLSPVLSLIQG